MITTWRMERLSASPHRLPDVVTMVREYVLLTDAWTNRGGPPTELPEVFKAELERLPLPAAPPMGETIICIGADGRPVGQGLLIPFDDSRAEIKRLYVRPPHQGHGAGRTLVRELLESAHALGYQSVVLDVMPGREGAIRLYDDMGFVNTKPFRTYEHHNMIFMRRSL
ncbi:MAG TPA: GNAT family N-acetyltransferase [Acidimicrobiales bacterium]